MKETTRLRVKDKREIKEVRSTLDIMSKLINRRGPTLASIQTRKELTERLYELEHPETKGGESLRQ